PLNFIHSEAPMYKENLHYGIKNGADGPDVLLMHAVSRIMFNNYINNIQTSWVKEGAGMAQLVLSWGANDFGGTLINESISTAAGAAHGQLLKPKDIRQLIKQAGRIPAQRTTSYKIIKTFGLEDGHDPLDEIQNTSQFGSYHELIKLDGYRYKNNRRK
ncbi:MAG TPA: 7,8-didemethyl-8-hydroxy-5-deazariboflavin synthase subunit CofH, partial [Candidatus Nitrosotalea sp.]|nr:7,8-didemethyl-8-hydroxy-5-deazariboflavin synthase subunit CofH [Candidatus Nitrosotalea sp.]